MHEGWESDIKALATTKYHVPERKESGNLALSSVKSAGRALFDGVGGSVTGFSRRAVFTGSAIWAFGASGTFGDEDEGE